MSKKKKKEIEVKESGEQLDLIDFHPKNSEAIVATARLYKKFQVARMAAGDKEVEQKQKILELVKAENLQTLAGDKVRFELDGVLITITPRDELITVKDKSESE